MAVKRARRVIDSDSSDGDDDFEIIGEAMNTGPSAASTSRSRNSNSNGNSNSNSNINNGHYTTSTSTRSREVASENAGSAIMDEQVADQIRDIDDELESIREQVQQLLTLEDELKEKRAYLLSTAQKGKTKTTPSHLASASASASNVLQKTDYSRSDFPWSTQLKARLKDVWNHSTFRFCQEAVCNAALDGRDAVVIMPTGSGKSICYQLPALLSEGLTVVVSPLISLMLDQVLNLRQVGVEAELLSAAVSRSETAEILRMIRDGSSEVKLLYVTPERVAKSKTLMTALQKAYERGQLSHIVIDEAHCAASMGHDYRPDYKGLSIFRKVFPDVPLQMLTATCGPKVLEQVIQIMGVKPTTSPESAAPNRTLLFQAPLYRPNLRYAVLPRPSASQATSQTVADWILKNHRGQSGIVYCLSKKDTENMAQALNQLSNGTIRAAAYHADVEDEAKTNVHTRWRQNKIQVVCATIAFGMGIDKPDVRFVIHACISKSIEGLYQESGRAGRDGKDADCVLFYRSQDATRISSLVAGEPTGTEKIRAVLEYVQSERCRKIIFGEYFADTSGGNEICGRCDNCVSPPQVRDLTFAGWQVLKVAQDVHRGGGRLTLAQLADIVRGLGGGRYTVSAVADDSGGGRKGKQKGGGGFVDLNEVAGGKVELSKDDCERLVVGLLIKDFLQDDYLYNAYAVNVYVQPGPQAIRLTRLSQQAAKAAKNMVQVAIPGVGGAGAKPRVSASKAQASSADSTRASSSKAKRKAVDDFDDDDLFDDVDDDEPVAVSGANTAGSKSRASTSKTSNAPSNNNHNRAAPAPKGKGKSKVIDESDEDEIFDDNNFGGRYDLEDDDELEALLDAELDRRFGDDVTEDEDEEEEEEVEDEGEDNTLGGASHRNRQRNENRNATDMIEDDFEEDPIPVLRTRAAAPAPLKATTTAPRAPVSTSTSTSSHSRILPLQPLGRSSAGTNRTTASSSSVTAVRSSSTFSHSQIPPFQPPARSSASTNTTAGPSSSGTVAPSSSAYASTDGAPRKRFRPYIPPSPSGHSSSSMTTTNGPSSRSVGGAGTMRTRTSLADGDADEDEEEALLDGMDLAGDDGWEFRSVGPPRLAGTGGGGYGPSR